MNLPAGLQPPSAGEVGRLAHVTGEGGVGHRAHLPRPRGARRNGVGDVEAPARALVVQRDELVDREGAAEAPAKLCVDARGDALESHALGGLGLRQAALPRAPLVDRGVEAHPAQASEALAVACYGPFGRCLTTYE